MGCAVTSTMRAGDAQVLRQVLQFVQQPPKEVSDLLQTLSGPTRGAGPLPLTDGPRTRAICFLLDPGTLQHPEVRVEDFVLRHLPRLLVQLHKRTEAFMETNRDRVRGRINWPATLKARSGKEPSPTSFTCRQPQHEYDTQPNQVVRHLLELIGTNLAFGHHEFSRGSNAIANP
jgi:hypothetical protein